MWRVGQRVIGTTGLSKAGWARMTSSSSGFASNSKESSFSSKVSPASVDGKGSSIETLEKFR